MRKVAILRYFGRSTIRQCAATLGLARKKSAYGEHARWPLRARLSLLNGSQLPLSRPSGGHPCLCPATQIESSDPFCYFVTSVPHPSGPFRDQLHLSHNVARGDT